MTSRCLLVVALVHGCASTPSAPSSPSPPAPRAVAPPELPGVDVPTRYHEGLFFARPVVAKTGETLNIYLDTGGNNVLFAHVAERLGLARVTKGEGERTYTEVAFPALAPGGEIPLPTTREGRVLMFPAGPRQAGWDGMLGPEWFGGRCWSMDYPARRLRLLHDCTGLPSTPHTAPLGFAEGLAFPRIQATIDGETIDLLFDSGAQTKLAPAALAALADGRDAVRATSFITHTIFERWRAKHPDWRVIERAEADTHEAMIEVPAVTIAGYTVGPVWFTRRADNNFHAFMSQWMDRRIDGALGANALAFFRIIVDYPGKRALFAR